ncbi:MAG: uroporphyrinogen-III C-methyltransferase [Kangiellaceae bacterium]|nr:uroporphyrinogen-III C-methyltransferase [Kangiellaceae bacterium]
MGQHDKDLHDNNELNKETHDLVENIDLETNDTENNDSAASIGQRSKPIKKKGSALKWLISLILLGAIAYAAYYGWQQWQTYNAATEKADLVSSLNQQLKAQDSRIKQLVREKEQQSEQIDDLRAEINRQVASMQEQLRNTQRKLQAYSDNSANQQNEWMLAEAEYLIRQAAQKLHFSEDARSIVALLQAADLQLQATNDSSLTHLRQAISNDINSVRSSGNLDIEGVSVHLETLKQSVSQLELASVNLKSVEADKNDEQTELELSRWQHFKQSVSDALGKYYTVHEYNESVKPFISPQQDGLLRQNILLNLQTAQLAAMQHNQASYQAALQETTLWLNEYFKQQSPNTQAFQAQLEELLAQSVQLDLPTQLSSQSVISQISERKVQQWLEQEPESRQQQSPEENIDNNADNSEPALEQESLEIDEQTEEDNLL